MPEADASGKIETPESLQKEQDEAEKKDKEESEKQKGEKCNLTKEFSAREGHLIYKNVLSHTPLTPAVYIGIKEETIEINGEKYKLTNTAERQIKDPSHIQAENIEKFIFSKEDSKFFEESKKQQEQYEFKIEFTPNSYNYLSDCDHHPHPKYTQFVFRLATKSAIHFVENQNIVTEIPLAWVKILDNGNHIFFTRTNVTEKVFYNETAEALRALQEQGKIKKDSEVVGSYTVENAKVYNKETGKEISNKELGNTKDWKVSWKIACYVTGLDQQGHETVYVLDGEQSNTNIGKSIQEFNTLNAILKKRISMKYKDFCNKHIIKPYDTFSFIGGRKEENYPIIKLTYDQGKTWCETPGKEDGLVEYYINLIHKAHNCKILTDKNYIRQMHDPDYAVNSCNCNVTHHRLRFKLYDFKLETPEFPEGLPNKGETDEIWFAMHNLTEQCIQATWERNV